mgnify:FL=1
MTNDRMSGDPHPTAHALRVFGGALGMGLIVAGVCVVAAQWSDAFGGCGRCRALAAGAVAAMVIGFILVRSAWRAMRVRVPSDGGREP